MLWSRQTGAECLVCFCIFINFSVSSADRLQQGVTSEGHPVADPSAFLVELKHLARENIRPWTARRQPQPYNTTDVDQLFKKTKKRSARFRVRGSTVEREDELNWHPGLKENAGLVHRLLEVTSANIGLPDGLDVVWNMHDAPVMRERPESYLQPPLFSFCTARGYADVPTAATEFIKVNFEQPELLKSQPWTSRSDKAFWRGTPTGIQYTLDNWRSLQRPQLINISRQIPELIDAQFTACYQCDPGVWEEMLAELGQPDGQGLPSQQRLAQFKYLIDLDGNGWSSRFLGQLAQGSAIFKLRSRYREFFWDMLTPYVHYVPVRADMSDLPELLQYAQDHDAEMEAIGAAAAAFFAQFGGAAWQQYLKELLTVYHSLFGSAAAAGADSAGAAVAQS